jgi:SAM-dependent methyltransferase
MMASKEVSPFYKDSGNKFSLASRVSYRARKQMFDLFMSVMKPQDATTILDLGVTSDTRFQESNFFEQFYPYKKQIVCVGTEDGSHLEKQYGIRFVQTKSGEGLPFSDKQFDIVFSNAVIEHAGSATRQAEFIREASRVGKRLFITTPNRWFPIEHHTAVPLLHYLPSNVYRGIIRRTSLEYWSHEENLNLLTKGEFAALFPSQYPVTVQRVGLGFGPFISNLVAYSKSS